MITMIVKKDGVPVEVVMQQAQEAYEIYQQQPAAARAAFLDAIAAALENKRAVLVPLAGGETNLPAARLNGE